MSLSPEVVCPDRRQSGERSAYDCPQIACHWRPQAGAGGFTLMEMMVVVLIIAILVGITAVALNSAKEKARQTDCMSNLRQLGTALVTYRADNSGRNPAWLSNLYPTYIDDKGVYVCRSDKARGHGRNRPAGITAEDTASAQKYSETIDNDSVSRHSEQNTAIEANSYFYEFNAAPCSWRGAAGMTWSQAKEEQLAKGDEANTVIVNGVETPVPYSSSRMPIVRCFHHAAHSTVLGYRQVNQARDIDTKVRSGLTLNVAYAGNVTIAPIWWEGTLEAGEER